MSSSISAYVHVSYSACLKSRLPKNKYCPTLMRIYQDKCHETESIQFSTANLPFCSAQNTPFTCQYIQTLFVHTYIAQSHMTNTEMPNCMCVRSMLRLLFFQIFDSFGAVQCTVCMSTCIRPSHRPTQLQFIIPFRKITSTFTA